MKIKCPNCKEKIDLSTVFQIVGSQGGKTSASKMTKAERIARATKASLAAAEARKKKNS